MKSDILMWMESILRKLRFGISGRVCIEELEGKKEECGALFKVHVMGLVYWNLGAWVIKIRMI